MASSVEMQHEVALLLNEAVQYHQAGQLDAAEALYQRVLARQRSHVDALHLLGVCRHEKRDFEGALRHLRTALKSRPDQAALHVSIGNTLRELKRPADAILSYQRAVRIDPAFEIASFNLGSALEEAGRHAEARDAYDRVLKLQPTAAALLGRGNCLYALGRVDEALEDFDAALQFDAACVDAHNNRAAALIRRSRYDEALAAVERALALQPQHAGAKQNLCLILNELGRPTEALQAAQRLLAADSGNMEALVQSARALVPIGQSDTAIEVLERGLALQPGNRDLRFNLASILAQRPDRSEQARQLLDAMLQETPADAPTLVNRGMAAYTVGRYGEARAYYERALAQDGEFAQARFNLGLLDLLEGDLASGWRGNELRWEDATFRAYRRGFAQPLWLGDEDIAGETLLVHAEQGAGDTLQFCRYVPLLAAGAGKVLFEVPRSLHSLLRRAMPPQIEVLVRGGSLPEFDRQCPLLSLPLAFGTTLVNIPATVPYLQADPQRVETWRNRLSDAVRLRVGLAWAGSPTHGNDRQRSIPLREFQALLTQSQGAAGGREIEFVALVNELRRRDWDTLAQAPRLQFFGEALEDFDDTAALAELCDVVVSVDTSAAHLAAALGKPTWLLLPQVPDWRWMLGREDSPWYPGLRVLRQREPGNWSEVLAQVQAGLQDLAGGKTAGKAAR
jgi:tetratricopeptide (TPR) repeat protein